MRVAFVAAYAAPFHIPPLNALAERCDLHVLYLDDTRSHDVSYRAMLDDLAPDTTMKRAWHIQLDRSDLNVKVSVGASRWLSAVDPDVLFVLGYVPAVWETLAWTVWRKRPMVMWSESSAWTGSARGRFSQATRSRLIPMADAQISNGSQATEFLRSFDFPADRIVESPYPIAPVVRNPAGRNEGDPLRVVFVGRLIERKRPLDVVDACETLARDEPAGVELRIVGSGPQEDEIADRIGELPWAGATGRLEGADLAAQYEWADVVVVPSEREVWGLVVNEALAHGAWVIASDQVASAIDLLTPGSGASYATGDADELAQTLAEAAASLDRSEEGRMRRIAASQEHAPGAFDAAVWAEAVMRAVEIAVGGPQ